MYKEPKEAFNNKKKSLKYSEWGGEDTGLVPLLNTSLHFQICTRTFDLNLVLRGRNYYGIGPKHPLSRKIDFHIPILPMQCASPKLKLIRITLNVSKL